MGGIEIDTNASSSIPGLFAAGECTGGLQGGNRLSGNALAELLVFGSRAGQAAVDNSKNTIVNSCEEQGKAEELRILATLKRSESKITPNDGKNMLRKIMGHYMGVTRTGKGMEKAAQELKELIKLLPTIHIQETALQFNQSLQSYLELEKMVTISQSMVEAACIRKESRGAHFREDYPECDISVPPQSTLAYMEGGNPIIKTRPVKMTEITQELSA